MPGEVVHDRSVLLAPDDESPVNFEVNARRRRRGAENDDVIANRGREGRRDTARGGRREVIDDAGSERPRFIRERATRDDFARPRHGVGGRKADCERLRVARGEGEVHMPVSGHINDLAFERCPFRDPHPRGAFACVSGSERGGIPGHLAHGAVPAGPELT